MPYFSKQVKQLVYKFSELNQSERQKLKCLGAGTLLQILKERHPMHFESKVTRATPKFTLIKIISEERWFPSVTEINA